MKVLSLKQPWAKLVVKNKKTIELRKWNTNLRGEFLIHASKNPDKKTLKKFKLSPDELTFGAIVGKANLVKVKDYKKLGKQEFIKDKNKHLITEDTDMEKWGHYGFVLTNPKKFNKPIPAKGKLGFWEFDLINTGN